MMEKKPYTKDNVVAKLCETMDEYHRKWMETDRADEKLVNTLAETVIEKLIVEFEKEFE